MKNHIAATLAIVAALGSMPSIGQQLVISKPPSRFGVPASGAAVEIPYAAAIQWSTFAVPCGSETHAWTRDGADPESCSDSGSGCTVHHYYEAVATRGSHVARDAATFRVHYTSDMTGACIPMSDSASRTYVVQYAPTATILTAPAQVQMNHSACYSGRGTVDTELSSNHAPIYKWNWGDGSSTTNSTGDACHTWAYSAAGNNTVTFTVSDGDLSASQVRTVFVYGKESGCTTC